MLEYYFIDGEVELIFRMLEAKTQQKCDKVAECSLADLYSVLCTSYGFPVDGGQKELAKSGNCRLHILCEMVLYILSLPQQTALAFQCSDNT